MICSSCGEIVSDDAIACKRCGAVLTLRWTFDKMLKVRENLAQSLGRQDLPTDVRTALEHVYEALSRSLLEAAKSAGAEKRFLEAEAKWEEYRKDVHNPDSALARIVRAENSAEVVAVVKESFEKDRGDSLKKAYNKYQVPVEGLDDLRLEIERHDALNNALVELESLDKPEEHGPCGPVLLRALESGGPQALKQVALRERLGKWKEKGNNANIFLRSWYKLWTGLIAQPKVFAWLCRPTEEEIRLWETEIRKHPSTRVSPPREPLP